MGSYEAFNPSFLQESGQHPSAPFASRIQPPTLSLMPIMRSPGASAAPASGPGEGAPKKKSTKGKRSPDAATIKRLKAELEDEKMQRSLAEGMIEEIMKKSKEKAKKQESSIATLNAQITKLKSDKKKLEEEQWKRYLEEQTRMEEEARAKCELESRIRDMEAEKQSKKASDAERFKAIEDHLKEERKLREQAEARTREMEARLQTFESGSTQGEGEAKARAEVEAKSREIVELQRRFEEQGRRLETMKQKYNDEKAARSDVEAGFASKSEQFTQQLAAEKVKAETLSQALETAKAQLASTLPASGSAADADTLLKENAVLKQTITVREAELETAKQDANTANKKYADYEKQATEEIKTLKDQIKAKDKHSAKLSSEVFN